MGISPLCRGGARRSSQTSPCCLGCAVLGGHSCTQTCISVGAGSAGWVPRVTWGSRRSPPAPNPCPVSPLSPGTPAELPALRCTPSSHAWVDVGWGAPALCVPGWGFGHAEPGAPLWAPSHPHCGYSGCSRCQIQLSLRCQQSWRCPRASAPRGASPCRYPLGTAMGPGPSRGHEQDVPLAHSGVPSPGQGYTS